MNCVRCSEEMISDWRWRESEHADKPRHAGRGLCHACRQVARRDGTIENYPRINMPRQELLEEVAFMVDGGTRSLRTMADHLGLQWGSIRDALLRAAKSGDETAISIRKVITP